MSFSKIRLVKATRRLSSFLDCALSHSWFNVSRKRTAYSISMISTRKKRATFWTTFLAINKYPANTIRNHSLAKTASTLAIYVPFYEAQPNVNFVRKEEPPKSQGGEDFRFSLPEKDMKGKGFKTKSADEIALEHPIKVNSSVCHPILLNHFFLFFAGVSC